jgi:hypothetical protein|tara:strand:+ start:1909 stop:2301 length:393 start_codon:yes stop_codon:yes gene_type:complete
MSFLEPVIASLLGAAVTALAVFLKKNMTAMAILKYGPLVEKAYDIIDPVLDKNLSNWDGSKVDKAFELAVESVADGQLSADEIKKLAVHMAQSWLPGAAAQKVRLLEQNGMPLEQRKAAEDITAKVNTAS